MSEIISYHQLPEYIIAQPPLLMVDRLEIMEDGQSAKGCKCISMNEHFFQGHFPGQPIMPGVLQIAAMVQVGSVLAKKDTNDSRVPHLKSLTRVKFRKPVLPGDFLTIEANIKSEQENGDFTISAKTIVDGEVTCQAIIEIALADLKDLLLPHQTLTTPRKESATPDEKSALNIAGIIDIIPHRFPFLLVDKVYKLDLEALTVTALKNITGNEPYFAGTPLTIMPNFLLVEAAAQAACALALSIPRHKNKIGFFMSIDSAKFYTPIVPGDQVIFELKLEERGHFGKTKGNLYVGDKLVAEMALKFALLPREN